MVKITTVIITLNEERNIARCLESIQAVADEILVVDSFSTDGTREICSRYGARFLQHAFEGYAAQKNWANSQALHPYVLSIDADEQLSEELKKSILKIKEDWTHDSYSFNRLNNYCGQWIRRCGWYPDRKIRLWDTRKGRWTGPNPHERLEMNPGVTQKHLAGDLLHFTTTTIADHVQMMNKYAVLGAQNYFETGKRSSIFKIIISPWARFLKMYLFNIGFLDGYYGYVIARTTAYATKLKYIYLYDFQRKKNDL